MAKNLLIASIETMPSAGPLRTLDPFLFCVHHVDHYPAGDGSMRAPRRGNGADFNPAAPYRMYHGDDVPGFPQHPHRGFETLTATMEGVVDHSDSLGNAGRYGNGDLQWVTAGKGIVHGEMMPLINTDKPNTLELFQIWLNLPAKSKMVDPAFVMHWAEDIPKIRMDEGKAQVTVWAGKFGNVEGGKPTPHSYATNPAAEVGVWLLDLKPGGRVTVPPAIGGRAINRRAYFVLGSSLLIGETSIKPRSEITLYADQGAEFVNPHPSDASRVLILQGKPIGEPVVQHGPFVMNTREEIQQAFSDYRRTQFGGWPWPQDAMIFPAQKKRFALINGVETNPPGTK
eukprot:gene3895-4255_t